MRKATLATLTATFLFAVFLGRVDGWAHAFTVVVLPTVALGLALAALAFRERARRMVRRITAGRPGRILDDGHIFFDDGELPVRASIRNRRVTPGPAIAIEPAPKARVEPGCLGEALVRWRDRRRGWTTVAVAAAVIGAAPLLGALLVDVIA